MAGNMREIIELCSPMDLICPVYWLEDSLFEANLQSWIKELPLKRIILGINRANIIDWAELMKKYSLIKIVDQLHLGTLGGCLADLMKQVTTDWFVYVHSDVRITPNAFRVMEPYMKKNTGIIESERLHWDGICDRYKEVEESIWFPSYSYVNYYSRKRAFSGFQIFQKKVIIELIDKIEDDYLYRNEDYIFQSECLEKGFDYVKTYAMHIHQVIDPKWTYDRDSTNMMQWRGIVKYSNPNPINILACILPIRDLKERLEEVTLESVLEFCWIHNAKWAEHIIHWWDKELNPPEIKK